MNRIVRTLIITSGVVAGTVVLGIALFAAANVLAERQAQALVAKMDCHSHDEEHSPVAGSSWIDFLLPSDVKAQEDGATTMSNSSCPHSHYVWGEWHTHYPNDDGSGAYTHRSKKKVKHYHCPRD